MYFIFHIQSAHLQLHYTLFYNIVFNIKNGLTNKHVFTVFILQTPGHFIGQFHQFVLERVFSDILGDTTFVAWTDDSTYVKKRSFQITEHVLYIYLFFQYFRSRE